MLWFSHEKRPCFLIFANFSFKKRSQLVVVPLGRTHLFMRQALSTCSDVSTEPSFPPRKKPPAHQQCDSSAINTWNTCRLCLHMFALEISVRNPIKYVFVTFCYKYLPEKVRNESVDLAKEVPRSHQLTCGAGLGSASVQDT